MEEKREMRYISFACLVAFVLATRKPLANSRWVFARAGAVGNPDQPITARCQNEIYLIFCPVLKGLRDKLIEKLTEKSL